MASAPPTSGWLGAPPPPYGAEPASFYSAPLLPAVAGLGPPGRGSSYFAGPGGSPPPPPAFAEKGGWGSFDSMAGPPFPPPYYSGGGGPPPPPGMMGPPMPPPGRISYRKMDPSEYELGEDGKAIVSGQEGYRNWSVAAGNAKSRPAGPDKAQLAQQIRQKDQQIRELEQRAQQLRHKAHHFHDDWQRRIEMLEAHILHAKLHPVTLEEAIAEERELPAMNIVPNGLLKEFEDKAVVEENDDEEEEDEEEQREQEEAEDLARLSAALELPALWEYPPNSRIVDIRLVEGPDEDEYQWMPLMPPRRQRREAEMEPPPTLQGRIFDSNWAFTPSPYHPVGVMAQNGLVNKLYPIDRAPISYEDVFQSSWPGANEAYWTAYADYFGSRRFPGRYREVWPDRDCDRGVENLRNVQWRTGPPRRENVAAMPVDVNRDGFYDVVVVGRDANNNGIPDAMEIPRYQRKVVNACAKVFGNGV